MKDSESVCIRSFREWLVPFCPVSCECRPAADMLGRPAEFVSLERSLDRADLLLPLAHALPKLGRVRTRSPACPAAASQSAGVPRMPLSFFLVAGAPTPGGMRLPHFRAVALFRREIAPPLSANPKSLRKFRRVPGAGPGDLSAKQYTGHILSLLRKTSGRHSSSDRAPGVRGRCLEILKLICLETGSQEPRPPG